MTKYYTRKECFDACSDDDIPFIRDGFNSMYLETKKVLLNYDVIAFKPSELDSDKWQIKRAKPKVLSSEEWVDKRKKMMVLRNPNGGVIEWYDRDLYDCAEFFKKQGQLREYLRPEQVELRRCVADVITHYDDDFYDLQEAYKNLKPPYEQ